MLYFENGMVAPSARSSLRGENLENRPVKRSGDGGVSDQTPITWLEYIHILAMSVVLAAAGTAGFYFFAQLLP
jgi:hypothetical protein